MKRALGLSRLRVAGVVAFSSGGQLDGSQCLRYGLNLLRRVPPERLGERKEKMLVITDHRGQKEGMTVELESLCGEHILTGASLDAVGEPVLQVVRFTLDGQNYEAVENPEDGYRSSLGSFGTTDIPAKPVARTAVVCRMVTDLGKDEILGILNAATLKEIISIGTADVDDYYPGFVACFSPENLLSLPTDERPSIFQL